MVGENLAIIAVILLLAAVLARRGKRTFALLTLPLVSVPVLHLIGWMAPPLRSWVFLMDIFGVLAGILLCVILSRVFTSRPGKIVYIGFCSFFMIAVAIAYLIRLY